MTSSKPSGLLNAALAQKIAALALAGVTREFPHKPDHVISGPADLLLPRQLHPAFYGCYDWHSAVHSHWVLVELLQHFPNMVIAPDAEAVLDKHFAAASLSQELDYLQSPGREAFERPYGWAWLFRLVQSVKVSTLPAAADWRMRLKPLADCLADRMLSWLARQTYPVRSGTHSNTAFAMGLALDYAYESGLRNFEQGLKQAASRLFGHDRNLSISTEPSGGDFLSPLLCEIDLMRRVLPREDWAAWLNGLLPDWPGKLAAWVPASVSDRHDGQGVHLDGLNLSRAWHLAEIAAGLDDRAAAGGLWRAGRVHWEASASFLSTGDFLGEHWLGTFALQAALSLDRESGGASRGTSG